MKKSDDQANVIPSVSEGSGGMGGAQNVMGMARARSCANAPEGARGIDCTHRASGAAQSEILNTQSVIVTLLAAAIILGLTTTASAQLMSDQVPHSRTVPDAEQVKREMETARYNLGAIRLRPEVSLKDLGYENNVLGTADNLVSDWHVTGAAGARAIMPFSGKMYVRGTAIPAYTWYHKLRSRRAWGGEYTGSILGLFNRLTVEAGASSIKEIAPVSSEIVTSAMGTRSGSFARGEVQFLQRLSAFGSVQTQNQRYENNDEVQFGVLAPLERDESFVRGGLRYSFRTYVDFSVAAETGHTNFVTATDRDNMTNAVIVGLHYDRPRTFVNLSIGSRKYEPRNATSTFPSFSTTTGSYYAERTLGAATIIDIYGHRALQYSLTGSPYYIELRNGVGLTLPVGYRLGVRGYFEAGYNDYPVPDPGSTVKRSDRMNGGGIGLLMRLYRKTALIVMATNERYDSNIDVGTRSMFRITTFLSLGGDTFK